MIDILGSKDHTFSLDCEQVPNLVPLNKTCSDSPTMASKLSSDYNFPPDSYSGSYNNYSDGGYETSGDMYNEMPRGLNSIDGGLVSSDQKMNLATSVSKDAWLYG